MNNNNVDDSRALIVHALTFFAKTHKCLLRYTVSDIVVINYHDPQVLNNFLTQFNLQHYCIIITYNNVYNEHNTTNVLWNIIDMR